MLENIVKSSELHLMNEVQFLCFLLEDNGELYATNVFKVREVVNYTDGITTTEGEDNDVILGFMSMRGESIPLLDLRRWIYFNVDNPTRNLTQYSISSDKYLIVICDFSGYTVGLRIFDVKRIIQRSWSEVMTGNEYGFEKNGKVIATTKFDDGKIVQVLDIEKMLSEIFPMIDDTQSLNMQSLSKINSDKIVLVVEDSKSVVKSMQAILEKLGLKHYTFSNGEELFKFLNVTDELDEIGVIMTDLEMPVISGFEVLKQVKSSEIYSHIPVIVNTSMSSESNIQIARSLKADAFITKLRPVEIEFELKRLLNK